MPTDLTDETCGYVPSDISHGLSFTDKPLTIYVAGRMRGVEDFNFPAFDAMRDHINRLGHRAVSPADLDRVAGDVDERAGIAPPIEVCMKRDIAALLNCDAIALMHGWLASEGACNEHRVARMLGLTIFYPDDVIPQVTHAINEPDHGETFEGLHTECGPLNPAGRPIHHHIRPQNNDHTLHHNAGKEVRMTSVTGGQKGKKLAELGAIDPNALMDVAAVAGFGAQKYATYNYTNGFEWSLAYNALQRHLHAFWAGTDIDPESGLPHLAHAAWHCLALLTFLRFGAGTDDRFPLREEGDVA